MCKFCGMVALHKLYFSTKLSHQKIRWNYGILRSVNCVKSVQIRSFFWSVFSRIWTEYGEIWSISPYSSPNAGKFGLEKTPYLDIFLAVSSNTNMKCLILYVIFCYFYLPQALNFFMTDVFVILETNQLICRANQWTSFHMIRTSVMKELIE